MMPADAVCLSTVDWGFLWQVHHEVAIRLARGGTRVFYVENTGVRSPRLRDASRVAARLENRLRAVASHGWREVAPSVFAHAPLVLPPFGGPLTRAANRRLLLPWLRRQLDRFGLAEDRLLLTFLPSDTAVSLLELLRTPSSVVVYYCLHDYATLTPDGGALRTVEDRLVRSADVVFANSQPLVERFRRLRPDVHLFPPGIDLAAFPPPGDRPHHALPPADLQQLEALPRPVLGYVGGLHRFFDAALVAEVARRRPDWSFVLVGPRQRPLPELDGLPNVHLLGERPHRQLPALLGHFDAGLIPYTLDEAAASIVPVKLNEYLAAGLPVVSTGLPSVREHAAAHGVVEIAERGPEAFLRAVEVALARPVDPGARSARRAVAALVDWDVQFARMATLIESRFRSRTAPSGGGGR